MGNATSPGRGYHTVWRITHGGSRGGGVDRRVQCPDSEQKRIVHHIPIIICACVCVCIEATDLDGSGFLVYPDLVVFARDPNHHDVRDKILRQ